MGFSTNAADRTKDPTRPPGLGDASFQRRCRNETPSPLASVSERLCRGMRVFGVTVRTLVYAEANWEMERGILNMKEHGEDRPEQDDRAAATTRPYPDTSTMAVVSPEESSAARRVEANTHRSRACRPYRLSRRREIRALGHGSSIHPNRNPSHPSSALSSAPSSDLSLHCILLLIYPHRPPYATYPARPTYLFTSPRYATYPNTPAPAYAPPQTRPSLRPRHYLHVPAPSHDAPV